MSKPSKSTGAPEKETELTPAEIEAGITSGFDSIKRVADAGYQIVGDASGKGFKPPVGKEACGSGNDLVGNRPDSSDFQPVAEIDREQFFDERVVGAECLKQQVTKSQRRGLGVKTRGIGMAVLKVVYRPKRTMKKAGVAFRSRKSSRPD